MAGAGLYANINAKRKRGEKMRSKGAKGAPSEEDFKNAAKTAKMSSGGSMSLSPKQKKIASMADPKDKITGEDFKKMKRVKKASGDIVTLDSSKGKGPRRDFTNPAKRKELEENLKKIKRNKKSEGGMATLKEANSVPKKRPNVSRGGGAAIKGTKFSGVF